MYTTTVKLWLKMTVQHIRSADSVSSVDNWSLRTIQDTRSWLSLITWQPPKETDGGEKEERGKREWNKTSGSLESKVKTWRRHR